MLENPLGRRAFKKFLNEAVAAEASPSGKLLTKYVSARFANEVTRADLDHDLSELIRWRQLNEYRDLSRRLTLESRKALLVPLRAWAHALRNGSECGSPTTGDQDGIVLMGLDDIELDMGLDIGLDLGLVDDGESKRLTSGPLGVLPFSRTNTDHKSSCWLHLSELRELRTAQLALAWRLHEKYWAAFSRSSRFKRACEEATSMSAQRKNLASEAAGGGGDSEDENMQNEDDIPIVTDELHCLLLLVRYKDKSMEGKARPNSSKSSAKDEGVEIQVIHLFPSDPSARSMLIGRGVFNAVTINDAEISRSHGKLEWGPTSELQKGQLRYTDLGSSYGSKLSTPGKNKGEARAIHKCFLRVNDKLQVGKSATIEIKRAADVRGYREN
jgi:hypothetical protein